MSHDSVSEFEVAESGVIESLAAYLGDNTDEARRCLRLTDFLDAFARGGGGGGYRDET